MKANPLDARTRSARRQLRHAAALALAATGAASTLPALYAEETAEASEEPKKNWVEVGVGGSFIDGNTATYQQRIGLPEGAFGGIRSFHYETEVATNTVLKIDGRGIFDNHDYSLRLDLAKEGLGYVRGGYSEFRTYYDASGGYLPQGGVWYGNLFDDDQYVDRREFWVEAGLRLEKWPEFTIRYSRTERDGQKGSTSWGDATTPAGVRRITPSFYDLDEARDLIAADARKTFGKVDVNLGVRYEMRDTDNTRNLRLYPGEGATRDRHVTQRDATDSDLFNVHGYADTRLNDKLRFTVGYAYTDLDMDATGYRIYGNGYDPDLAERLPAPVSYDNLSGGGNMSQHVANVNFFWNVAKNLDLIPSLRVEKQDRDAFSSANAPAAPLTSMDYVASSDRGLLDVSEALELRYSGITNLVLFAKGEWLQGSGDLDETWDNLSTGFQPVNRSTDDERNWQKYAVGANWYPLRRFSFGAGYYHKIRENDFDHTADNTSNVPPAGNRYPAYLVAQSYTVDDFNVRATWRARNNLTLVARYDYQIGTMENQSGVLNSVDSADIDSQIISGSISWVPLNRLYLQARLSFAQDSTETPVSGITTAVMDAENDYWTGELTAGYAVSDDIDLEATYFYFEADNFEGTATTGVPYNASSRDQGIWTTATWRINPRVRWMARYGFYTVKEDMFGGYNDVDAHVLYTTVQYRF